MRANNSSLFSSDSTLESARDREVGGLKSGRGQGCGFIITSHSCLF